MTAIWGPLGWMTLHSVATSYSEVPSREEKQLVSTWLDMFRDTITCPSCREHFTNMLANYRAQFPNMLQSRHEFVIFTLRAHNAVNRRLNKPVYSSVEECLIPLRNNVKNRSAKDYRISYVNHITRHWRTLQDITGIVALKKINAMKRIELEYVAQRDTNFTSEIRPDIVILPQSVIERTPEAQPSRPMFFGGPTATGTAGFRITTRGLRLQR